MTTVQSWIQLRPGEIILRLHVQPRAGRRGVAGVIDDRLKVRVTEPPANGQANAAVVHLVAELAGVPKSAVMVSHGAGGREKTLRIATAEPHATAARLLAVAEVHRT
jgi:uncharacterized protein (TIGR00251 family)